MSNHTQIRVGIVGAGEITQTTHLPVLQLLSSLFKVTAVCDPSASTVAHCQRKFGIPAGYQDAAHLVESPDVDLVVIACPDEYHATVALAAIAADKHVLIEKPVALTQRDAQSVIEAAREKPHLVVCVGYMRRYAAAMSVFKRLVSEAGQINYVVVRDIIGANSAFVSQSGTRPMKANDFPLGSFEEKSALGNRMVAESIGTKAAADPKLFRTWRLLNGLSSHDISAMREVLGKPLRVKYASSSRQVTFLHALFEYDGFDCHFETGVDAVASFDASIEVFAEKKRVKLVYDSPYIKGLPVRIEVKEHDESGSFTTREVRVTYEDPYTQQFTAIYDNIISGTPVKTPVDDALQDLSIFEEIVERLRGISPHANGVNAVNGVNGAC